MGWPTAQDYNEAVQNPRSSFSDADLRDDIWSSADGRTWRLETAHAGWSPRAYHQAVVHGGRIYVLGGGNYTPAYHARNDVWSSTDGVNWTQVTASAGWSPRIAAAVASPSAAVSQPQ